MTKTIFSWFICICLFVFGVLIIWGSIEKHSLRGLFAGVIFINTAVLISPPGFKRIQQASSNPLMWGHKAVIAFGGIVLGLLFMNPKQESVSVVDHKAVEHKSSLSKPIESKNKIMDVAEFKKLLSAELGALPAHWQSVTVDKVEDTTYGAILIYKDSPTVGKIQFAVEGKIIVRAMLKVLTNNGHKPSDELLIVRVSLREAVVGETGKELVRFFGRSTYNPINDQIEFSDKLYGL